MESVIQQAKDEKYDQINKSRKKYLIKSNCQQSRKREEFPQLDKEYVKRRLTANIVPNGEMLDVPLCHPQRQGTRQGSPLSPIFFNSILKLLTNP
jgi:hypothetical protein